MARLLPQAPSLCRSSLAAYWIESNIAVSIETIAPVIEDVMSLRERERVCWLGSVSGAGYV